ncbi:hypothetical protein LG200_11080 [Methylobacillus caricis]|uniref:hypothetical protein n=1 Tax=Methylobacillus caricis TaxID=1971611 RepID=UPI001CFFAFF2|nr:hypothetical protein [Methylobacillus caricis]MCB5188540.1 hypothetical protein [Methylobacillus caricis]
MLTLIAIGGWWLLKPAIPAFEELACADIVRGCGNAGIFVQADQAPRVMQPFELRIKVGEAQAVLAKFDMRDMQMGLNQYRFVRQQDGDWLAKVTLPVCMSGQSDWLMNLELDTASGKRFYQLGFTANP